VLRELLDSTRRERGRRRKGGRGESERDRLRDNGLEREKSPGR